MVETPHATVPQLPLETPPHAEVRWFCAWGCVVERGGECNVIIGGTLVGRFGHDDRDRGRRNVLMVTLAEEPSMHFGHLAAAFGVGEEYLRVLRRKAEAGGLGAVLLRRMGDRSRVTSARRATIRAWFEEGLNPTESFRRQSPRGRLSRATLSRKAPPAARWRSWLPIARAASAS